MPPFVLLPLYVALLLAPLALAWLAGMPRRPLLDELSSGMALVAFAVLLVEFVLSGRFRPITGRIGMDVTMRLHQRAARWIVALIVLHPFLYTLPIPAHPPPWDATAQGHLGLGGATRVTHVLGEPPEGWDGAVGLIDAAAIARAFDPFPDAGRWCYLLCGPPPMIAAAEAALKARGIPRALVRAERFSYD